MFRLIPEDRAGDEGVSPVIAVILMVAITVVLAATVYVWVSGFASEDAGPEQASATARGTDLNDDGDVEWIRITLTKADNAPYDVSDVTISATGSGGSSISKLCETATLASGNNSCVNPFADTNDAWDAGESLWVPCQASGNHALTASVRGTTILDSTIKCEAEAPNNS